MTLPEGIVTFLFTDIEGSTRLLAEIGDTGYGAVLDTERALVVDAAVAEGGVPFAGLWPRDLFPAPDPDTADPALRSALAEGAAWSREEAVDHAIALADGLAAGELEGSPGRPERRTMPG